MEPETHQSFSSPERRAQWTVGRALAASVLVAGCLLLGLGAWFGMLFGSGEGGDAGHLLLVLLVATLPLFFSAAVAYVGYRAARRSWGSIALFVIAVACFLRLVEFTVARLL